MEKALHKISVRALSERLYRTGSLYGAGFGSVSGQEGTRVHQRVFQDLKKQYETDNVISEYSLSKEIEFELFRLQIAGRADCVLEQKDASNDSVKVVIFEIKTHNRVVENVDQLVLPTHEAQVKLYAHMYYCLHPEIEELSITLR